MKEPLILAIIFYFCLVGLLYLVSAIALIVWKYAIAPVVVYLSNRNYREKVVKQALFYNQSKVLFGGK